MTGVARATDGPERHAGNYPPLLRAGRLSGGADGVDVAGRVHAAAEGRGIEARIRLEVVHGRPGNVARLGIYGSR